MEAGETVSIPSRKDLRKQKLMEYLAAKGKLKEPNPRTYLKNDCQVNKPVTSTRKVVMGKENKTPADTFTHVRTKVATLPAESATYPTKRVFGVSNNVNVICRISAGQKVNKCPSAPSGPAQPKPKQNPVITMSTARSYNVHQKAPGQLNKKPNTVAQSLSRASSNAPRTVVTKSNSRFRSSSNVAWSCWANTADLRMSLGPLVKTKTGLIPAATQPRTSQSQKLTHASVTAGDATASIANKVRPRTSSSVSLPKRSAMAPGKTLPPTARHNPANERSNVSSTERANQNKSNSKLLSDKNQPSHKSQLSSGLKPTPSFSKCTAAPIKPQGRAGISRTSKPVGLPTDRSTKQRSEVFSRMSSGPASRATQAAVAAKTCKKTDGKKGSSSINAPPPQPGLKRTRAPVMSQTLPQPTRTTSRTGQDTKIPVRVIPQTEWKKQSAAQEERMRKLQEWRHTKGISYKRPPMPVKPQVRPSVAVLQPFWATMKEEEDAHSLIAAVDRSLADCIKLLGEGCPSDQVKAILSRLPAVSHKFAKYWICQARLMELEGHLDVLPMFEEAVGVVLEPVDELRSVVFDILKKRDEKQASDEHEETDGLPPSGGSTPESDPLVTPKPVRALICGEKGNSSRIKYKITATPGGPPSQRKEPARLNGQEVRFFTPVRRSVRIESASLRYPASLQDHDLCVSSYSDLISKEGEEEGTSPSSDTTPMYVYRQNEALVGKVVVQLVCDDDA